MSAKKSEQLGMSHGKASNILRKSIIFHLANKCGMGNCYQCGQPINDIDNFTIEHKEAWLDSNSPSDLYFDMNNIAFSHSSCNYKAKRNPKLLNSKPGVSGYRGVLINTDRHKERYKYVAKLYTKKKNIFIGYFNNPKEAAIAYDKKAEELLGQDAITNASLGLL